MIYEISEKISMVNFYRFQRLKYRLLLRFSINIYNSKCSCRNFFFNMSPKQFVFQTTFAFFLTFYTAFQHSVHLHADKRIKLYFHTFSVSYISPFQKMSSNESVRNHPHCYTIFR